MADYLIAYGKTAKFEGGYANDPDDRGGETWRGVARKMHPDWAGWKIVDSYKRKPGFPDTLRFDVPLHDLVLQFYNYQFWKKLRGDEITDQSIANTIFDFAVNAGVGTAVKHAQSVAGLPETGIMDQATIDKINGK
jgi:lysozyme family protein